MFYGVYSNEWRNLQWRLEAWLKDLPAISLRIPAKGDPVKALCWISEQEKLSSKKVSEVALSLAKDPRQALPRLCKRDRHFLRERMRMVLRIVEALGSECPLAREPIPLFALRHYEDLEEQQIAWALVGYWDEHGSRNWYLEQMNQILYSALVNGWKPAQSS